MGLEGWAPACRDDLRRMARARAAAPGQCGRWEQSRARAARGRAPVRARRVPSAPPTQRPARAWVQAQGQRRGALQVRLPPLSFEAAQPPTSPLHTQVHSLSIHPSRPDLCASGGSDGRVTLWDLRSAAQPAGVAASPSGADVWEVRAGCCHLCHRVRKGPCAEEPILMPSPLQPTALPSAAVATLTSALRPSNSCRWPLTPCSTPPLPPRKALGCRRCCAARRMARSATAPLQGGGGEEEAVAAARRWRGCRTGSTRSAWSSSWGWMRWL